jgi:hypothetical protein
MIDNMGHSRIPQTAAAFFAEQIGIEPLHPVQAAETVALVQMTEYHPPQDLIARVAPPIGTGLLASRSSPRGPTVLPDRSPTRATTPPVVPPTTPAVNRQAAFDPDTAGRRYPFDQKPAYDPRPTAPSPAPSQFAAARPTETTPASAGSASRTADSTAPTRIGATESPRGNWLADSKPTASPAAAPRGGSNDRARPSGADRAAVADARRMSRESTLSTDRTRTAGRSPEGEAPSTTSYRRFSPSNAGPKEYGPFASSGAARSVDRVSSTATDRRARSVPPPPVAVAAATDSTRRAEPPVRKRAGHMQRVNIRLSGPAIGTAPHYLAYGVELPYEQIAGADFLWMDNGVWIGDEPRGVKILESPGLHRITVLIVTKDNAEYRGSATVQVLDRGPTAAAY